MTAVQRAIKEAFPELELQFDEELAPLTYMKIGGPAEVLLKIADRKQLQELVEFATEHEIPLRILGGASNVLISDAGLKGLVIFWTGTGYQKSTHPNAAGKFVVTAETGWKTALLVRKTIDDGLAGLVGFLGVPGTLGGAVYNNAHYQRQLIGEFVQRIQVLKPSGEFHWMTQPEAEFSYDHSIFQSKPDIIVQVELALETGEKAHSLQLIKEATEYRAKTQPLGEPSSGCYFRNPKNTPELQKKFPQFADRTEISGAFLIDQAGLKGFQIGQVQVSQKHAAFLINLGGGSSSDVCAIAEEIQERVAKQFGVQLEPEVFFLE